MSQEGVLSFYAKADTDETLGKQLAQVEPGEGALNEIARLATEAGFDVTPSDIVAVETAVQGSGDSEVSDDELSAVAGGLRPMALKTIKPLDIVTIRKQNPAVSMDDDPTQTGVIRHRSRWK